MSIIDRFFRRGKAMKEVKAPKAYDLEGTFSIFLAGSIEMGSAEPWQDRVVKEFDYKKITFLNPRRDDWDSSWKQEYSNKQFREQVEWELQAMEDADAIAMYFDPETKSPITLLELGLHAKGRKPLIVCCPDGYWRKGNVETVCNFYLDHSDGRLIFCNTYEEFIKALNRTYHEYC